MRLKILASVSLAAALGLVGCSGSSNGTSSSSSSSSTTSTSSGPSGTASTTTGGTHSSSSTGSTTGSHSSASSSGGSGAGTTTSTAANSSGSSGGATTGTPTATGSSGGSGSTVSTSTIGGSSGGTTGNPNIDTDCGSAHTVCNDGQHCQPFGGGNTGVPQYFTCACTQEDSQTGTTDSCRDTNDVAGTTGLVVCDSSTYDCRAPRDYEQIYSYAQSSSEACAANFTYVHFVQPLPDGGQTGFDLPDGGIFPDFADGGFQLLCLENCNVAQSQFCSANWTHCEQGALVESYPDGGQNPIDACVENDCGPDLKFNAPDGGTYTADAGAFYAGCDSDGTVGSCQPLPSSSTNGYIGVCYKVGTAGPLAGCSGFFGLATDLSKVCSANELCFSTQLAPSGQITSGVCLPTADCAQLTPGSNDCTQIQLGGVASQCAKFNGDPTGTDLQAGYCN